MKRRAVNKLYNKSQRYLPHNKEQQKDGKKTGNVNQFRTRERGRWPGEPSRLSASNGVCCLEKTASPASFFLLQHLRYRLFVFAFLLDSALARYALAR